MKRLDCNFKSIYGAHIGTATIEYGTQLPPQFLQSETESDRYFEQDFTDYVAGKAVYKELAVPLVRIQKP
jgi:hypothetical protein